MELLKVLAKQGNLVPLVEKVRRSYLLLPAWYHVSSNSLRTPPLKWTTWSALCSVRSMGMWGDWISAVFMCITGLSIVLVRSWNVPVDHVASEILWEPFPRLCHLPVHRIIAYFPNSEWRSHHRKFTALTFQFTPKIGLIHGLYLWNPLHVK